MNIYQKRKYLILFIIKATEQAIKDLEKMKAELQKLKEEKHEDE